jgi:hypothetical protein
MSRQKEPAMWSDGACLRPPGNVIPRVPWIYLVVLFFTVAGALYVYQFGVNVPWLDQWEVVSLLQQWSSGTLHFSHLLEQHNEHRILFPNVLMLALGLLTSYNTVAEMYLIVCCLAAVSLMASTVFWRDAPDRNEACFFLFVPMLLLSFKQFENLLWGFQITFAFVALFAVASLFFLEVHRNRPGERAPLVMALVSAVIASFSSIHGLLVWPAGLIFLLVSNQPGTKRNLRMGWTIAGVACWVAYFHGYSSPAHHPQLSYSFYHLPSAITFFLTLLGESLGWSLSAGLVVGIFLVICLGWSVWVLARTGRTSPFWISVVAFSFMTLASITVGRVGFGPDFAQASRYSTFSLLAIAGLHALTTQALSRSPGMAGRFLCVTFRILLCIALPLGYYLGWQAGAEIHETRAELAQALRDYREAGADKLLALYPSTAKDVRSRAEVLERLGYSVFARKASASTPQTEK